MMPPHFSMGVGAGTGAGSFGPQLSPPAWANELLEEVKQIKQKLNTIDKIERTVNSINSKVTDLEAKFKTLNSRVEETEKTCEFISSAIDSSRNECREAKLEIKNLKQSCEVLTKRTDYLKTQNNEINAKVTSLEYKSMNNNLMFYGIGEDKDENCVEKVKMLFLTELQMEEEEAGKISIDKAYRVGTKSGKKIRPIVAHFHYMKERDAIRQRSFDFAGNLKSAKRGVGAQLPKEIREGRKPFYAAMKEAKDAGKEVKFVGTKLYIDGIEHRPIPKGETAAAAR
jgi:DNA repair exonuclease SbcCD ATPase subunit